MPIPTIQKNYKALGKLCPKKKRRTKIKANPWYNKTLKALAEKVKKKAYKNSKRLLGESKVYYKKLVSKYEKTMQAKKSLMEKIQRNKANRIRHGKIE